ncbi:hypothetical protein BC831DRAFT_459776 [Entophlyctis helioformis]|nr:hypothetical protein BC831DRAFT_459776 [Entophlyctis helioformis]
MHNYAQFGNGDGDGDDADDIFEDDDLDDDIDDDLDDDDVDDGRALAGSGSARPATTANAAATAIANAAAAAIAAAAASGANAQWRLICDASAAAPAPPQRQQMHLFQQHHAAQRATILKRHEYEPVPAGSLINISPSALVKQYSSLRLESIADPSDSRKPLAPKPVWFMHGRVHPLELDTIVHDIFSSSMLASVDVSAACNYYVSIRDAILALADRQPAEYLSLTDCVNQLPRPCPELLHLSAIHRFLEHHGILNAQTQHLVGPIASQAIDLDLIRFGEESVLVRGKRKQQVSDSDSDQQQQQKRNRLYQQVWPEEQEEDAAMPSTLRSMFSCKICSADTLAWRYESIKFPGLIVCPSCFADGRFPSDSYGHILGSALPEPPSPWTPDEIIRLLDALERHGLDWGQVADDVLTRSPADCAAYFAQIPILEPAANAVLSRLEDVAGDQPMAGPISQSAPTPTLPHVKQEHGATVAPESKPAPAKPLSSWATLPSVLRLKRNHQLDQLVGDAPNPLMSLIHILATTVHPALASEAARIGFAELSKSDSLLESPNAVDGESDVAETTRAQTMALLTRQAAVVALDGAIAFARSLAEREEYTIKSQVRDLVLAQIRRVQVKLGHLESLRSE